MKTVRTVDDLRAAIDAAATDGRRPSVGLVPTMGALHDGHLSLVHAARRDCDLVVVSVFVNPAQFNDTSDLAAYPRDEAHDFDLAASAGADLFFAPPVAEIYPPGYATTISIRGVSEPLEGAHRGASHFDGVATVVAKLLIAAQPDVAYFGQKDAQQVAVVRRLVSDLRLPVRIEACPTVREADGLAMSSRNVRLNAEDRSRAAALNAALNAASQAYRDGADPRAAEQAGCAVLHAAGLTAEYLALVHPDDFMPVEHAGQEAFVLVAAQVGPVRLIDNQYIPPTDQE